ncbi:ATP-binding cassette domain-containing protein [Pseudactinotalea sp. HY160]|uniref:ABC transporter ATP-binding protein n=1 Tax=Pseudactinotalea sp. HY160 TaxID=2654490 RepID=UPI00128D9B89|nr:ABC transporter ATP-binding protein [Pseudactinotalea sp. HY160]MPV48993.1 ATP-binding cassette domain-containing protein [Pseudactinotalea sp. HY160]
MTTLPPPGSEPARPPYPGGLPFPPGPPPALHLAGLAKAFGPKVAVYGLTLAIPAGACYGIVGPNGAGKTTSLSMATGLLQPDYGAAYVHGVDLWAEPGRAKAMLGVLPDGMRLFDRLTGRELITYAGLLRGMAGDVARERTEQLLEVLDLTESASVLVADYSAGMRKKAALGCALVHAPRVVVLDEPFESVDPVSAAAIRALLEDFVAGGGTVVLSSHVMDLVQRMCSHVAVIAQGQLVAAGTLDEVRAGGDLETRFVQLVGGPAQQGGLEWLRPSSS